MVVFSRPAASSQGRADLTARSAAVLILAVSLLLAGCSIAPVSTSATTSWTPTPTPAPTVTIAPADDLFSPGRAEAVVAQLIAAADGAPIVRLVLDRTRARLTYVDEGDRPRSVIWLAGVVSPSDDGTDLVVASSFDPSRFNLSDVAGLFATAARISGSTERQELQINEYDDGSVYMTITTTPESTTVFFDHTGEMIPRLNLLRDADVAIALDDVLANRLLVVAVGINRGEMLWADVVASPGVLERRMRPALLPMYHAQRRENPSTEQFEVSDLDPEVLATLLRTGPGLLDKAPGSAVTLLVSWPSDSDEPVIKVEVDGDSLLTDLAGVPIVDP